MQANKLKFRENYSLCQSKLRKLRVGELNMHKILKEKISYKWNWLQQFYEFDIKLLRFIKTIIASIYYCIRKYCGKNVVGLLNIPTFYSDITFRLQN